MRTEFKTEAGSSFPLGADWDGDGVNFAIYSRHASKIELCLFDDSGKKEISRLPLVKGNVGIWHIYVKGLKLGQLYGYRADGIYNPAEGKKFNPHKLLLDPYAKSVSGVCKWHKDMYAYNPEPPINLYSFSTTDSASSVPKSVVVDDAFEWDDDQLPEIPWEETVIYEVNVKGLTALNPDIASTYRGKFLALSDSEMIKYFKSLGVTTLELMPCQNFFTNLPQTDKGVSNFWGYDNLCFLAPHNEYLVSGDISEFKTMVKTLHQAGIEVVLDVVFNHTTESNAYGPTLSFRGIDNEEYYKPVPNDKAFYIDDTGCGATFNVYNAHGLQLVMDALRYWAEQMHVDGFRFDLTPALCRELHEIEEKPAFLKAVHQDPVLQKLKMIAEPWDLGPSGYRLGWFPEPWAEWNDKFRDALRKFWRGEKGLVTEVAKRISGSADIFKDRPRYASINYIAAHDGFTLQDLVSYDRKHNFANGEENHDGTDNNWSWNTGVEGETDDKTILALREQRKRNFMASLILSAGTPMILSGDELSRTQHGNNNTYCQDNETAWVHWAKKGWKHNEFRQFTAALVEFRKKHNIFAEADYIFIAPSGRPMADIDWKVSYSRSLSFVVQGKDEALFVIMNAYDGEILWTLPPSPHGSSWQLVFDTSETKDGNFGGAKFKKYSSKPWSFALFMS